MKAEVGFANRKPARPAAAASTEFAWSATELSRASSSGENQVKALQSSPMKIRG